MMLNDQVTSVVKEDDLDAAAGRGLSSFVDFLKSAARDADAYRPANRREIDPN